MKEVKWNYISHKIGMHDNIVRNRNDVPCNGFCLADDGSIIVEGGGRTAAALVAGRDDEVEPPIFLYYLIVCVFVMFL